MEQKDKNIIMAKWLGLQEIKPGTFKFKGTKYAKLTQYESTSELHFHDKPDWLFAIWEKIDTEKNVCVAVQGSMCSLFCGGYYNGDSDTVSLPEFSCCREKANIMSAMYEVFSSYILWVTKTCEMKSDTKQELMFVTPDNEKIYKQQI